MKWNKDYIKDKQEITETNYFVGHFHSEGYYDKDCGGCIFENNKVNGVSKKHNMNQKDDTSKVPKGEREIG